MYRGTTRVVYRLFLNSIILSLLGLKGRYLSLIKALLSFTPKAESFKTFLKHTAKDFHNQSVNPPVVRASTIIFKSMKHIRMTQKKAQNEPLSDSWLDLSVYAIICRIVDKKIWGK